VTPLAVLTAATVAACAVLAHQWLRARRQAWLLAQLLDTARTENTRLAAEADLLRARHHAVEARALAARDRATTAEIRLADLDAERTVQLPAVVVPINRNRPGPVEAREPAVSGPLTAAGPVEG
jgi:hypothetical protein